jgi:hypothetical protein
LQRWFKAHLRKNMWVKRRLPLWSMPFCSNKTGTCLCRKPILLHFSNWARRWNKREHCIISHTRRAKKVIVVKGKSERRRIQSSLPKENRTLGTNFLDVLDLICGQG